MSSVHQPTSLMPTNRRLEAFSDGVFAIAITIMVLEIHIPGALAFSHDPQAFGDFATIFATYVLSFIVIANLWVSHHYLLFTVSRPTRATIWFNNLLLLCVTIIPVTTRFLGLHPHSPRAVAAYGVVAFACTAAFMLLRSHASNHTHNAAYRDIHRRVLRRATLFLIFYGASVPLAFVDTWLSWICFLIVPPMLFLPIIRAEPAPDDGREAIQQRGLERSCP